MVWWNGRMGVSGGALIKFTLVNTIIVNFDVCGHPDRRRVTHTGRCRSSVRTVTRGRTRQLTRTTATRDRGTALRLSSASVFCNTGRNARRLAALRGGMMGLAFAGGNKQIYTTVLGSCGKRSNGPLVLFSRGSSNVGFTFRKGGRGVLARSVCFRPAGMASDAMAVHLTTGGKNCVSFSCGLLPSTCVIGFAVHTGNVRGFFPPTLGAIGVG